MLCSVGKDTKGLWCLNVTSPEVTVLLHIITFYAKIIRIQTVYTPNAYSSWEGHTICKRTLNVFKTYCPLRKGLRIC